MKKPSTDPSVLNEPHLSEFGKKFEVDESERKAEKVLAGANHSMDQKVEHTVWDEPALSGELVKEVPPDAVTYKKWLSAKIADMDTLDSWMWTFMLAFAAGPWAVAGVFMLQLMGYGVAGAAAVVLFGPVTEEMLKISAALITIEKRPYIFRNARQIFICCFVSGLIFSTVENLLYLNIYIAEPSPLLILWRWTVCVLLHTGCVSISSIGLIKMWKNTMENMTKPRLPQMSKYLIAACVIHGVYNLAAVLIDPFFR